MKAFNDLFASKETGRRSIHKYLSMMLDKQIQLEQILKHTRKKQARLTAATRWMTEHGQIVSDQASLPYVKISEKHKQIQELISQLESEISYEVSQVLRDSKKIEIYKIFNLVNILSLSNEIAEILDSMLSRDESDSNPQFDFSQEYFVTQVNQIFSKVDYLPTYNNSWLTNMSLELGRLALAFIGLSSCFLIYSAMSHSALIAAVVFIGVAVTLLGIGIALHFMDKKTSIAEVLFKILNQLKYRDLKLDYPGFRDLKSQAIHAQLETDTPDFGFMDLLSEYSNSNEFKSDASFERDLARILNTDRASDSSSSGQIKETRIEGVTPFTRYLYNPSSYEEEEYEFVENHQVIPSHISLYTLSSESSPVNVSSAVTNPIVIQENLDLGVIALDGYEHCANVSGTKESDHTLLHASSASKASNKKNTKSSNASSSCVSSPSARLSLSSYGSRLSNRALGLFYHRNPSEISDISGVEDGQMLLESEHKAAHQYQINRLAFYPASVLLGEALLSYVGQGILLAAAPPLINLACLAAISACLLAPLFAVIKFLIDKNLPYRSHLANASYALLYLVDMFLNIKLISYLGFMLHNPIMNVYALYSILGAGILPVVTLGIVASFVVQAHYSYHNHRNTEVRRTHIAEGDEQNTEDEEEEESKSMACA